MSAPFLAESQANWPILRAKSRAVNAQARRRAGAQARRRAGAGDWAAGPPQGLDERVIKSRFQGLSYRKFRHFLGGLQLAVAEVDAPNEFAAGEPTRSLGR
jgi:hypothetical protein